MNWSVRINRPLRRYAIRLYVNVSGGWRWSHRQDWWPGLRLELSGIGTSGSLVYKDRLIGQVLPWDALAFSSQELTIIGSGPSVASQDFSSLLPGTTILLNGAIHLLDGKLGAPMAVVVEDERFVWRHFADMRRLIAPQTQCLFSTSVIRAICEIDPTWLESQRIFHIDFLQKPYDRARRSQTELEQLDFLKWSPSKDCAVSLAPAQGVFSGGSVAVTAMQLALYMNPSRIGLAGIDLSNAKAPRFYEGAGGSAKSRILQAQDRILAAFAVARSECASRRIALVNYSPVSSLATIDIPYDSRLSATSQ